MGGELEGKSWWTCANVRWRRIGLLSRSFEVKEIRATSSSPTPRAPEQEDPSRRLDCQQVVQNGVIVGRIPRGGVVNRRERDETRRGRTTGTGRPGPTGAAILGTGHEKMKAGTEISGEKIGPAMAAHRGRVTTGTRAGTAVGVEMNSATHLGENPGSARTMREATVVRSSEPAHGPGAHRMVELP